MNLPQLQPVTTVEETICGQKLTFRKAKLEDSAEIDKMVEKGILGLSSNIYMLALLMYGYDESFEDRLKFLNSLEFSKAEDLSNLNEVLKKLGLNTEASKKK
jgi:hypothetical protein